MLGVNLKSLRGVGYFVLQALRAATVITLAAAAAACWVLIILVEKDQPYFVFACASLCFTSIVSLALIFSEFPFLESIKNYLKNTWPVLSESHGLGWLGFATIMIGCTVLGPLNQPAYSEKELGSHFYSLVKAAGILCLTFGGLNVICALTFREGKEGITSRDIRANGSLATQHSNLPSYSASPASSVRNEKSQSKFLSMFWKKPDQYDTGNHQRSDSYQRNNASDRDERVSPIIPGIKRPDTALHPMNTGRSSRYSVANLSRF